MGSKPRDSGTAQSSSAGAQAADQALASQANQSTAYAKQAHDILFGADGKSGNLSGFLDPKSLDISAPSGVYKTQYNQDVSNIAQQSKQVQGSVARNLASRGFGNAPAGFAADEERQAAQDQVAQEGAAFTNYAGKSYQDALQNFWNATNIATGAGAAATNAAISADSSAANNYANLYGSAIQPTPSALGTVLGGGMQAGGEIGAAAVKCPCEGGMLLLHDGREIAVETLRKGDELRGIDGQPCPLLEDPRIVTRPSVEVKVMKGKTRCSSDHTFSLPFGGYEYAFKSAAKNVRYGEDFLTVMGVEEIGEQTVYVLEIGGSHSYRVDGFWSLS